MKSLKKVLAIVLALVMVCSFAIPAFAAEAEANTITVYNDKAGHTYEAYQVFAGVLADGVLTDITWGSGIDTDKLNDGKLTVGGKSLSAADWAKELAADPGTVSAADFADAVAKVLKSAPTAKTSEQKSGLGETGDKKGYVIDGLETGYYLVKDMDNSVTGQDAYTKFILKVVGAAEATAKSDYPDVEKDVLDKNDSDGSEAWGKSADHDINDSVDFKLTGDIPDTTGYKTYYYRFHDTMDTRLALQDGSFKVTVGGVEITTDDYKLVKNPGDGCTFEIIIKDLISVINKVKDNVKPAYDAEQGVVVTYQAKLTDQAVIGLPGQENKVKLEFSNNPNWNGDGKPGNPDNPDEPDGPTGETPEKVVVVFTFEADVNKTDGTRPLAGAKFTLEKFIEGAKNGQDEYDEYKGKKGAWTAVDETTATPGTTFEFKGLDDGYYRLTETEAPAGYNKLADSIYFTVSATHSMEETGANKQLTVTVDKGGFEITNGTVSTDVENRRGVELPETGGIGTTIFYIAGGLIVLFAVVMLVAKRRMKNAA